MKTKAVRLYGKMDLRLEEFELPEIKDDEILVKVSADSLCMSTYKAALLGEDHKRVPDDAADNPIIVGHELSGEILKIGSRWEGKYNAGDKFSLQPAINYKGSMDSPGYSYKYCGGDATYMILPPEVMIMDCLLPFKGEGFFKAALAEPYSCVIGACRSLYRTDRHKHIHYLGIKEGGRMAIIGGCGPMGLAAIDYALSGEFRPQQLIVTDLDNARLKRARSIFGKKAESRGISLLFINTGEMDDARQSIMRLTDNQGFDDMLVMIPFAEALEFGESLLGFNGCLNFFAGPTDEKFAAKINYYDVHYMEKHIIGTTGGNVDDMREALELMEQNLLSPEVLITHIGGLDSVINATLNLPKIAGGKKLVYTGMSLPLTAIDDLDSKAFESDFFKTLAEIVKKSNGLWSEEAEKFILENGESI
jgi:L-sorbose 1-phosphate reductase